MLIIICGLPGSGKSTLSKRLKTKIPAIYLNTDIIRKQITKNPTYDENEKKAVYLEMMNIAEKHINQGRNVILDATFSTRKFRDLALRVTDDLRIIECTLPEQMVRARLDRRKERNKAISDAGFEIYQKMKESFEEIEGDHLVIDCSLPKGKQEEIALKYLGLL